MQLPNNIEEIMGNMPPQMMQNLQQGFAGAQVNQNQGGMGGLGD